MGKAYCRLERPNIAVLECGHTSSEQATNNHATDTAARLLNGDEVPDTNGMRHGRSHINERLGTDSITKGGLSAGSPQVGEEGDANCA